MAADASSAVNTQTQEDALQGLIDYCHEQNVIITPSIAAQSFPGRGLGIYTTGPIKKGEKLIHIPAKSMLTTQSISESFLPKTLRKRFTVHCALAAFLAFGPEEDLKQYRRWMATWPKFEEFTESLPVLWKEDFRKSGPPPTDHAPEVDDPPRKRRKTLTDVNGVPEIKFRPRFSRSFVIDDHYLTLSRLQSSGDRKNHLIEQASKIRACVNMIDKHLPQVKIREASSHDNYLRFLYMWSCVNSRCFYYLRPGQAAPADSNEAMALCPYQDLFNHSDSKGCYGEFDKRGFFIKADRDYGAGQELFLKYGKHSNDMLWMEYGFMMDVSKDDETKIDPVVLGSFGKEDTEKLGKAGYKGDYTLKKDGVCYRTIMASYLKVLSNEQWTRMTHGGFDPETNTTYAGLKIRAKKILMNWVSAVKKETEENLKVLTRFTEDTDLIDAFVGDASLTEEQRKSTKMQVDLAGRRRDMCVRRWKQILDMCMGAAGVIEAQTPKISQVDDGDRGTVTDKGHTTLRSDEDDGK